MHRSSNVSRQNRSNRSQTNMWVDFDVRITGDWLFYLCDHLNSCLDSHSDGTHSLQNINGYRNGLVTDIL